MSSALACYAICIILLIIIMNGGIKSSSVLTGKHLLSDLIGWGLPVKEKLLIVDLEPNLQKLDLGPML
jgi:hypothetical protein